MQRLIQRALFPEAPVLTQRALYANYASVISAAGAAGQDVNAWALFAASALSVDALGESWQGVERAARRAEGCRSVSASVYRFIAQNTWG